MSIEKQKKEKKMSRKKEEENQIYGQNNRDYHSNKSIKQTDKEDKF